MKLHPLPPTPNAPLYALVGMAGDLPLQASLHKSLKLAKLDHVSIKEFVAINKKNDFLLSLPRFGQRRINSFNHYYNLWVESQKSYKSKLFSPLDIELDIELEVEKKPRIDQEHAANTGNSNLINPKSTNSTSKSEELVRLIDICKFISIPDDTNYYPNTNLEYKQTNTIEFDCSLTVIEYTEKFQLDNFEIDQLDKVTFTALHETFFSAQIKKQIWSELTNNKGWLPDYLLASNFNSLKSDSKKFIALTSPSLAEWLVDVSESQDCLVIDDNWNVEQIEKQTRFFITQLLGENELPIANTSSHRFSNRWHEFAFEWALAILNISQSNLTPDQKKGSLEHAILHSIDLFNTKCIGKLSGNQFRIVRNRMGWDTIKPRTLEDIGQEFSLTRERVRQIEEKSHKNIKKMYSNSDFRFAQNNIELILWLQITKHHLHIPNSSIKNNSAAIHDSLKLGIFCHSKSIAKFIRSTGKKYGEVNIPNWIQTIPLKDATERLSVGGEIRTSRLPKVVIDSSFSKFANKLAIECNPNFSIYKGHVRSGNFSSRPKRTVNLHNLMRRWGQRFIALQDIYCTYRTENIDDQCTMRDLTVVIEEAPYLFLRGELYDWMAIENIFEHNALTQSVEQLSEERTTQLLEEEVGQKDSIANKIIRLLRENGILGLKEICRGVPDEKAGSITRTTVTDARVIWVAPGLIGLWSRKDHYANELPDKLFTEYNAWKYAEALYAGESDSLFPTWSNKFEQKIVVWAEDNTSQDVYTSLVAVCNPNRWSCEYNIQQKWQQEKETNGNYVLQRSPDFSASINRMDFDRFVALLHQLRLDGTISWVGVNKIFGFRLDGKNAIWPLVFLVATGCVLPQSDWQKAHTIVTDRVDKFLREFILTIEVYGNASWRTDNHQPLVLPNEKCIQDNCEGSWVPSEQAIIFLTQLFSSESNKSPTSEEDEIDIFDMVDSASTLLDNL